MSVTHFYPSLPASTESLRVRVAPPASSRVERKESRVESAEPLPREIRKGGTEREARDGNRRASRLHSIPKGGKINVSPTPTGDTAPSRVVFPVVFLRLRTPLARPPLPTRLGATSHTAVPPRGATRQNGVPRFRPGPDATPARSAPPGRSRPADDQPGAGWPVGSADPDQPADEPPGDRHQPDLATPAQQPLGSPGRGATGRGATGRGAARTRPAYRTDMTAPTGPASERPYPVSRAAAAGEPIRRPHARFRAHTATRPAFRCRACGAPWPCQPARLSLLLAYRDNRIGLLVYLACQLHRALHDLPNSNPAQLSTRFLGWVPR
jgi:hypothetical protein